MGLLQKSLLFGSLLAALGCSTLTERREPSGVAPAVLAERTRLLKVAADNKVLIQIEPGVFNEADQAEVGSCRKISEPLWAETLSSILDLLERQPALAQKIHLISFEGSTDQPQAQVMSEVGLQKLVIKFAKSRKAEQINYISDAPCADSASQYIGQTLFRTQVQWPDLSQIESALQQASLKNQEEITDVDTSLLSYLAEQRAFLRFDKQLLKDRSVVGEKRAIYSLIHQLSGEVRAQRKFPALEDALQVIALKSEQGAQYVQLGLHSAKEQQVPGVRVTSQSAFSAEINGLRDLTYPYLVFEQSMGDFRASSIKDLNQCLDANKAAFHGHNGSKHSQKRNNFLYPGIKCSQ